MSINIKGYPGVASNVTFIDQCTPELCPLDIAVLRYVPSLEGNAAFAGIFAFFLVVQTVACFFYRTWSFTFCMNAGLVLEIVGYLARVQLRTHLFVSGPFLIQIICLTIAPVLYTAALYLTLSRIIMHYGPHNSRLSPKAYTCTFVSADLGSLILQSVGGGLANNAATLDAADLGVNIMVSGLAFQVFSLTCFSILCAEFFYRVSKDRKQIRATNWAAGKVERPIPDVAGFKVFLSALGFSTFLILLRSCFRVAELVHGFRSELANDEVSFMVLEGGVMILCTFLMTMFHPGRFIGEKWRESGWGVKKSSSMLELRKFATEDDRAISPVDSYDNRPYPVQH